MKPRRSAVITTATILVFAMIIAIMPNAAMALDLIVEQHPTDPSHFSSIQSALTYANNLLTGPSPTTSNFRVIVMADPTSYAGPITAISNVPIIGSETARTFITGGGTEAAITLNGVTNVQIRNFTFTNSSIGIQISSNCTNITISNNVFSVGTGNTAIQTSSPTANIVNNSFYQNGTAINTSVDTLITNNIFSTNGTAITSLAPSLNQTTYNDYAFNTSLGNVPNTGGIPTDVHSLPNISVPAPADPLFVDPTNFDFHLKSGSPCHMYAGTNAGNPNYTNSFDSTTIDMGANGGPNADTIPFPVANLASSLTTSDSVSLGWNPNNSYLVNGYHVYYGTSSGNYNGTGATEGNSPITIPQGTAPAATLSNLVSSAVTPSVPSISLTSPLNQTLVVNWTAAPGATGYKIYYSTSSFNSSSLPGTFVAVDGGSTTSYQLSGLTNEQTYYIAVSAVAQTTYFIAVTAFNNPSGPFEPGINNESAYSQVSQKIGTPMESLISTVISDFPEELVPYPNLPDSNSGCFIATAAYGHYSAPQVQALRHFRDQYLITNRLGSAFVRWYYAHSPDAAAWLDANPEYKPVVRAALLPAVGLSLFMTQTSLAIKIFILMIAVCISAFAFRRRRLSGSGGSR